MAKHKPRKSAPTEYTTDDEDLIMYDVEEEELDPDPADKFAIKECPTNFPKGYLRALFETLNKETATHIGIREAEDWFRNIDLAKECDIYMSSRSGSRKETPIACGYTEDHFKNRSRNYKPKSRDSYPQNLERQKKIATYAEIHLITQEIVRRVLSLKNLTSNI
ncbi:hypothetical protein TNCV_846851 [Trichonephila clavipes]|nr:hypothetical protein TNCV_846851 [Trichonephila clavipes]